MSHTARASGPAPGGKGLFAFQQKIPVVGKELPLVEQKVLQEGAAWCPSAGVLRGRSRNFVSFSKCLSNTSWG